MNKIYTSILTCLMISTLATGSIIAQEKELKAIPDNIYMRNGTNSAILSTRDIDVLGNDLPGECENDLANLNVTIISGPTITGATATVNPTTNMIQYKVPGNNFGQDKITYQITCGGKSSSAQIFINIGDKPDFIDEAECIIEPPQFVWDIERKAMSSSDYYVQSYANILVADLDFDGDAELITLAYHDIGQTLPSNNPSTSSAILIFNYNKATGTVDLKKKIDIPMVNCYVTLPIAVADVDDDGEVEIIIATSNGNSTGLPSQQVDPEDRTRVIAYRLDGTRAWTSSDTYWVDTNTLSRGMGIAVHDIDGDGKVEIYVGDRVFAGESGKLLATLPTIRPDGKKAGRGVKSANGGYLPSVGDIDGDGIMEIVGGNTTYKVTINSRTNPALNSATILSYIDYGDGYTSLADIDGDGILDVVVISYRDPEYLTQTAATKMYVWQGSSPNFIGTPQQPLPGKNPYTGVIQANPTGGSRAFVGDINGDGIPEICFTHYCKIDAYSFDRTTKQFKSPLWVGKYTSDTSASTTMSLFDFDNKDGAELVYRDETHIRILDKDGNNLAAIECNSGTHTEYPSVVDIDGDGHAEIVISGSLNLADYQDGSGAPTGKANSTCRVMVFGSKTPNTWMPARQVWNQHGYNPLYVNEDLTVPRNPLSPTTEFIREDGTKHVPFNNYLQQAGILNSQGDPLLKAPDLDFQAGRGQKLYYNQALDQLQATVYITNSGSLDFNGDLKLSLYSYSPSTNAYKLIKDEIYPNTTLSLFSNLTLNINVNGYSAIIPTLPADNVWYITINLDEDGTSAPKPYYKNQRECKDWNNITNRVSYVSGQIVLCEGETGVLILDPVGSFDCFWFEKDGVTQYAPDGNNKGDSKPVTKRNDTDDEFYLIHVFQNGTQLTISPDTAWVYLPSDSLIWTGNKDSDWHSTANWYNPNDPDNKEDFRKIPRLCTNVLIPETNTDGAAITRYPNLLKGATIYDYYRQAFCNNITFEHGGEVLRSDSLHYSKAFVQMSMLSNRWYCFAPPLRDFNSGDIYLSNPNPYLDDMFAFTRLFSQTDPQWNSYIEGNWGLTFNTPYYTFKPGEGVGVWLDDLVEDGTSQEMDFFYPKLDTEYYIYNENKPDEGPFPTNKVNPHRFIFEESINTSKDVVLQVTASTPGKKILVGNPFMSHLDFDKFYARNSHLIENNYQIMDQSGNYATYTISGVSTGNPVLTKDIAPMQAILVTPKTNIDPSVAARALIANESMTGVSIGNKLRNASVENDLKDEKDFMWVSISDIKESNRSAFVHRQTGSINSNYNAETDIYKLLRAGVKATTVYFLTEEGYYMDIKYATDLENLRIGIGFCSEETGPMALAFERLWEFAKGYDIYLEDKLTKKTMDMRESSIYSFEKTTSDVFVNDRFVLKFQRSVTGIEDETLEEKDIQYAYTSNKGDLEIFSTNGTSLDSIEIYDMQGRQMASRSNIADSRSNFYLNSGVYLVKIKNGAEQESLKVIVK